MYDDVVAAGVRSFSERTGRNVTPTAQQFITILRRSIQEDPHPTWGGWQQDLQNRYSDPGVFSDILVRVTIDENVMAEVTTFDLLHWISDHMADVCPVPKR